MMTISWAVRHGKAAARSAMARLSRAELQEVNRAKVLAAADAEFAERGFRDAKVDAIAERAELTRGAVYSNFPGKRALYFAVLAERAERAPVQPPPPRAAPSGRRSAPSPGPGRRGSRSPTPTAAPARPGWTRTSSPRSRPTSRPAARSPS
ncbi:TetR family transcriptional regulator [Nocardiopsis composta]